MLIDLTEAFGAGNEPSVSWCDANIPYFIGTYEKPNEIDCSGYGHHGTCPATLESISNTPRYKNATKFNGNTNYKITYASTAFNFTDNFSWSCWVKHNYTGWNKSGASYAFTVGRADTGGFGYGLQEVSATSMYIRFGN
jgi:hypothetical protein